MSLLSRKAEELRSLIESYEGYDDRARIAWGELKVILDECNVTQIESAQKLIEVINECI